MPDCPLAEECPSFTERIEGMGCTHYGDRGGAEWCNHYNQPIEDIHESGAGVGRTEDGFIIMVDGVLPPARARVKVTQVRSNHARAEELERLPDEPDDAEEPDDEETDEEADADDADDDEPQLGSRDNFWGS